MQLLDGKVVSATIKKSLKEAVDKLKAENKKVPHLAAILVGENPASMAYVGNKVKTCAELGYESTLIKLDAAVTEEILLEKIIALNNDKTVDGILVQLPLPKHISEEKIINIINPAKDVDGFHPSSVGKMVQGLPSFLPATPFARRIRRVLR